MKLIKNLFMLVFISAVTFSCNTDDDSSQSTTGDLVGTWELSSLDYSGSSATTFDDETTEFDFTGVGSNIDYELTFEENPNNFEAVGGYDIDLTIAFMGQSTTQTESIEDAVSIGTWDRDGNTLTFDGVLVSLGDMAPTTTDATTNEITISELTANTLVLTQDVSQVQSENGFEIDISISTELVFTRQ